MTNSAPRADSAGVIGTSAKKSRRGRWLIVIGFSIAIVLAVSGFLYIRFGFQPVRIEGTAMAPTLNNGDRVFISRRVGEIKRGDIVVFRFPPDTSKSMIKRIIALPGETIRMDERGQFYINGSPVDEPYVSPERNQHPRPFEVIIKADHYFVMGDNRDASNDSRSWGQLPRSLIYGKYMWTYWAF